MDLVGWLQKGTKKCIFEYFSRLRDKIFLLIVCDFEVFFIILEIIGKVESEKSEKSEISSQKAGD